MQTKDLAILVVSHNYAEITDTLVDTIRMCTPQDDPNFKYDIHVIETGSDLDKVSNSMTLWVDEGVRMTRGWNLLKQYADYTAAQAGYKYQAYQLFVNDARLLKDQDSVRSLYQDLMNLPDAGQIHPYQSDQPAQSPLSRQSGDGVRKVSFSEIICPMVKAEAWERCGPNFLDPIFFYGWGLDYDMPHQLHTNGYMCYISDKVGVSHTPFTSYRHADKTQETLSQGDFMSTARQNMYDGMKEKYGWRWPFVLLNSVPEDVDSSALFSWITQNEAPLLRELGAPR